MNLLKEYGLKSFFTYIHILNLMVCFQDESILKINLFDKADTYPIKNLNIVMYLKKKIV